jgi:hypothetical protein
MTKGSITNDERMALVKSLTDAYNRQIDGLTGKGPGKFQRKVADALKDGFRDGVLTALDHSTAS